MLNNAGPVAKLYLSIIDDVIDSMRELFLDEGLEDRVLDDLKHLWESKMMQSKAMDDFRNNNVNPANFVLQLPASYHQADQEPPVVIPSHQNIHTFPVKNSETLATFSLPAGLTYPVQIPAGVTLQTASGQLYKVNVPVVVTQTLANQHPAPQLPQKVAEQRAASASQPAAVPLNPSGPEVEMSSVPSSTVTQPAHCLPPCQEVGRPVAEPGVTVTPNEPDPQSEPVDLSMSSSTCSQLLDYHISKQEALSQAPQARDIDDILKEVIEAEREKAERASMGAKNQSEAVLGQDPLNSGDDVVEQDIPDLFDTDNVIVCQYDKIHRSKNRWKFHLKDGVLCYQGRDYVFSKAVGEAEW
uniref:Stonin-1 n=1 Tax=Gouania willdenowi TaxID=441366 RepID=A0A8C5HFD0_GOUWI